MMIQQNLSAQLTWKEVKLPNKISYKYIPSDPMNVRWYTLPNGLTVITSINKNAPRVQTFIATKAGSKNDPSDNTGLAHYLEHLLFKGTDKYGTKNFAMEKVYLDKIDDLYEKYNHTTDEIQRKQIYKEIDKASGEAAKYAIANEYDKMAQGLGAKGTNAFTSVEQTVYINDIPSNQMDKWVQLEAERFRNPIFRLFHTELEAVYEEKNISLDRDIRKAYEKINEGLFTRHAYGTQTTIGTVEHLKNPSIKKIRNYYNQYYVPNNMAIILVGDINPDNLIPTIAKEFGYMKSKPVPPYTFAPEPSRTSPKEYTVFGVEAEQFLMGFRFKGANTREAAVLKLVDLLLSNSKAGLIDINLVKTQKTLSAGSQVDIMKDYSTHLFVGSPLKGQSLDEVKKLLWEQINLLKSGNITQEQMKANIANEKFEKIKNEEDNNGRGYQLLEAFVLGSDWKEKLMEIETLESISKQEIIDFVNQNYLESNAVYVYKKTGEDKSIQKIVKPEITPVEVNRDDKSPFLANLLSLPAKDVSPEFLDFTTAISNQINKNGLPVYSIKNTENTRFKLTYTWDMGTFHNKKLSLVSQYVMLLGTKELPADALSKKMYELACSYDIYIMNEEMKITIAGLQENFEEALKIVENFFQNPNPDDKALASLIDKELKFRANNKLNKRVILSGAMYNFATYGKNNPFNDIISEKELKALTPKDLIDAFKESYKYLHRASYYGPEDGGTIANMLSRYHKNAPVMSPYPPIKVYERLETNQKKIYFVDFNMVQAEVMWLRKAMEFDKKYLIHSQVFNEYFGGGMSGIVFQTIRESKALAYSTYSRFSNPDKAGKPAYIQAYIGTQSDKLFDAIPAIEELINKMPKADQNFLASKDALKQSIESGRITRDNIFNAFENNFKLGFQTDSRKEVYNNLAQYSWDDMYKFYQESYQNKPFVMLVMGSKEKIDMKKLEAIAPIQELTLYELFGY